MNGRLCRIEHRPAIQTRTRSAETTLTTFRTTTVYAATATANPLNCTDPPGSCFLVCFWQPHVLGRDPATSSTHHRPHHQQTLVIDYLHLRSPSRAWGEALYIPPGHDDLYSRARMCIVDRGSIDRGVTAGFSAHSSRTAGTLTVDSASPRHPGRAVTGGLAAIEAVARSSADQAIDCPTSSDHIIKEGIGGGANSLGSFQGLYGLFEWRKAIWPQLPRYVMVPIEYSLICCVHQPNDLVDSRMTAHTISNFMSYTAERGFPRVENRGPLGGVPACNFTLIEHRCASVYQVFRQLRGEIIIS